MKTYILILIYVLTINIVNCQQIDSLLNEINLARSNPKHYSLIKNLQSERLDTLESKEPFILDKYLSLKAQQYSNKLGNTINNNKGKTYTIYHSDLKYNESICVTDFIHNGITQLIKDLNIVNKGHRMHLLSVDNNDTKIGIGIYQFTNPNMSNYYLIVIVTE